jgi:hypothetical protein
MKPFKFFKNNLFHFVVINRNDCNEYEDIVANLIVQQIVNGSNVTDASLIFTDVLTSHNSEIRILQVESLVDYFRIHYRVLDFITGISTRYINEFDYRTINRLVDDARI